MLIEWWYCEEMHLIASLSNIISFCHITTINATFALKKIVTLLTMLSLDVDKMQF